MKKVLVTIVALVFVFAGVGCGSKESADAKAQTAEQGPGPKAAFRAKRMGPGAKGGPQKPAGAEAQQSDEAPK